MTSHTRVRKDKIAQWGCEGVVSGAASLGNTIYTKVHGAHCISKVYSYLFVDYNQANKIFELGLRAGIVIGENGHRDSTYEGQMIIARIHDIRCIIKQLETAKVTDSLKAFLDALSPELLGAEFKTNNGLCVEEVEHILSEGLLLPLCLIFGATNQDCSKPCDPASSKDTQGTQGTTTAPPSNITLQPTGTQPNTPVNAQGNLADPFNTQGNLSDPFTTQGNLSDPFTTQPIPTGPLQASSEAEQIIAGPSLAKFQTDNQAPISNTQNYSSTSYPLNYQEPANYVRECHAKCVVIPQNNKRGIRVLHRWQPVDASAKTVIVAPSNLNAGDHQIPGIKCKELVEYSRPHTFEFYSLPPFCRFHLTNRPPPCHAPVYASSSPFAPSSSSCSSLSSFPSSSSSFPSATTGPNQILATPTLAAPIFPKSDRDPPPIANYNIRPSSGFPSM